MDLKNRYSLREVKPSLKLQFALIVVMGFVGTVALGTAALTTFMTVTEIAAPALSAVGSATIYPDSTSHTWKVSNNGGAYASLLTAAGASDLDLTPIRPAAIAGTANDYAPGSASLFYLTATGAQNISGLAAQSDGFVQIFCNVDTADNLTFQHNNAGSVAANRFFNGYGINVVLAPGTGVECIAYVYDLTNTRWTQLFTTSLSGLPTLVANTFTGTQTLTASNSLDLQGTWGNSTTLTCGGVASYAGPCGSDSTFGFTNSLSSSNVDIWSSVATNNGAQLRIYANGTGAASANFGSGSPGSAASAAINFIGASGADADTASALNMTAAAGFVVLLSHSDDVAAATVGWRVMDNTSGTGANHVYVKGGGLVALGVTPTALTCVDGAGTATLNVDPTSSTVIITQLDTDLGCAATMQETTVAGTTIALGAVVTVCSSPQSVATVRVAFADVANVFKGDAQAATGLAAGECFQMTYIDATDDLWLQTGATSVN